MRFFIDASKKYSKTLENILKEKNFDVEINNLLLLITNHLNDVYYDYKNIKVNVIDKEKMMLNYFDILKNDVNKIEIIKENVFTIKKEELGKTGIKPIIKEHKELIKRKVDEKNKTIVTQLSPIELYTSIVEIQPKYFYIKDEYLFKDLLQNVLSEGANINTVEIMKDFKGFSWKINHSNEFPYIKNLIFQNLIFLLGAEFMFQWEHQNTNLPDYIKEMKISLIKQFGEEQANKILDCFYATVYSYPTKSSKDRIKKQIEKNKKTLKSMNDSEKFLTTINRQKKALNKRLSDIDLMLNNDVALVEGFNKKNSILTKNREITSINLFKKILEEERLKIIERYDFYTMLQKPSRFLEYKAELKQQIKNFDPNRKINDLIIDLELSILNAFQLKIEKENTSSKLLEALKYLRYFKFLQLSENLHIKDIPKIQFKIQLIEKQIITKLCEVGTIQMLSYDIDINYNLIEIVLNTRILDLEELYIELDYKPMTVGMRIYDKNTIEKEEVLKVTKTPDLAIKLRRKTKLFR